MESDDSKLEKQVAQNPVEEAMAQPTVTTQTSTEHVMTEEEKIFGTDDEARALFADPSKKKMITGDPI